MSLKLRLLHGLIVALALVSAAPVLAGDDEAAADSAQDAAEEKIPPAEMLKARRNEVATLKRLVPSRVNTSGEADLLVRLVQTLHQVSALEQQALYDKSGLMNIDTYHATLKDEANYINTFTKKFPTRPEYAKMLFQRGYVWKELGEFEPAMVDLRAVADRHPGTHEAEVATILLAEIFKDRSLYQLSLQYLGKLRPQPGTTYYDVVHEQLGWAYFGLGDPVKALGHTELAIRDVRAKNKNPEKLLQSAALFYATAIEKIPGQSLQTAWSWMKRGLGEEGPIGKAAYAMALQLRSRSKDAEMETWAEIVDSSLKPADRLKVHVAVAENAINKKRFAAIDKSAKKIGTLLGSTEADMEQELVKARKALLTGAEKLQPEVARVKGKADAPAVLHAVMSLYQYGLQGSKQEASMWKTYHNYAELLFDLKQFENAVTFYKAEAKLNPAGANAAWLRAIAARFEQLKAKKLVAEKLVPRKPGETGGDVDPLLDEWSRWITQQFAKDTSEQITAFRFELARALYAGGNVGRALTELSELVKARPASATAQGAAALILDTYAAGEDWAAAERETLGFIALKVGGAGSKFQTDISRQAEIYSYKRIEKLSAAKDPSLKAEAEKYLKTYPSGPHSEEVLGMAGNAMITGGKAAEGIKYYEQLLAKATKPEMKRAALLTVASDHESHLRLAQAASHYKQLLALPGKGTEDVNALRHKALLFSWLSGDKTLLSQSISQLCPADAWCEKLRALTELEAAPLSKAAAQDLAKKVKKKAVKEPHLRALVALGSAPSLSFADRGAMIDALVSQLEKEDSMVVIALIPHIATRVPEAVKLTATEAVRTTPISADPRTLAARVQKVKEVEELVTKAMQVPWKRVQVVAQAAYGSLNLDLAADVLKLKAPQGAAGAALAEFNAAMKELAKPFEEQGRDWIEKAYASASENGVESAAFAPVLEAYRRVKAAEAGPAVPAGAGELDAWAAGLVNAAAQKAEGDAKKGYPALLMPSWRKALASRNLPLAFFLLGEARAKKAATEEQANAAIAATYWSAGARAEGLATLGNAGEDADPAGLSSLHLAQAFYETQAKKKAAAHLEKHSDRRGDKDKIPAARTALSTHIKDWLEGRSPAGKGGSK